MSTDQPEEGSKIDEIQSVGHRILDGVSDRLHATRVFLGRWFVVAILGILAVGFEVILYFQVGSVVVISSVIMALVISPFIYKAINVYYAYIMTVDLNPKDGTLMLGFIDVPRDRAHEIQISGSRGYVRDQAGAEIMLVSKFNPDTLTGVGTWPGNLTPLHFGARWKTAREVVKTYEALVMRYGIASVQARLDALADYVQVAETADSMLRLPDLEPTEEFKEEAADRGSDGSTKQ